MTALAKRLWYEYLHVICRMLAVTLFGIRCSHRGALPSQGGALIVANHQSFYDPLLVGVACDRVIAPVARDTLFRNWLLGFLIRALDTIPIDREGLGMAGLKEVLRRLKNSRIILLFAEGTRSPDGRLLPLKSGFSTVAKRGRVPLVTVALDGAFAAWPRRQRLPGLAPIEIVFGETLSADEVATLSDAALAAEVERRLRACLQTAQNQRRRRSPARFV